MLFRSDRKSTRLNSSHTIISYAVFCLKKKNRVGEHDAALLAGGGRARDGHGRPPRSRRPWSPARRLRRRPSRTRTSVLFFFNDTATTEIYTLSLHDALPI